MKTDSKRKLPLRLSLFVIALGAVLMAGKIYADSEPGLIPLVLVASGIGWNTAARLRLPAGDRR